MDFESILSSQSHRKPDFCEGSYEFLMIIYTAICMRYTIHSCLV